MRARPGSICPAQLVLGAVMLGRYLTYLARRPVSHSNRHFVAQRLAGLEPLIVELDGRDSPLAPALRQRLAALTPSSLSRDAPQLSEALLRLGLACERRDLIRCDRSPPREFAEQPEVRVVFGPAIGIGDEIACAQVLDSIRERLPAARVTVMSSYAGLWELLAPRCTSEVYRDCGQLLARLRGPDAHACLTIMIDFEDPGLLDAVVCDPCVGPYMELALAAQQARAFDPRAARVYTKTVGAHYGRSLYAGLRALLTWAFGARSSGPTSLAFVRPRLPSRAAPLALLVTPFTSKYDPQLEYWGRLLRPIVAGPTPVHLRIDSGTNHGTAAFARTLATSLAAQCSVKASAEALAPGPVALDELLRAIAVADLVIGVDTFAAHAAPRLGSASAILAQEGLEFWRVPGPSCFYLPERAPLEALGGALELLIATLHAALARDQQLRAMAAIGAPFLAASEALARALDGQDDAVALSRWRSYHGRWCELIDRARAWPGCFDALLADLDYEGSRGDPSIHASDPAWDAELGDYARATFDIRRRSNLSKYVDLCTARLAAP